MREKEKNILSQQIPASFPELNKLKDEIVSALSQHNIQKEDIASVELAIYEVIANIIEHGPAEHRDKPVSINLCKNSDTIKVIIKNEGNRFDLTKAQLPDIVAHYKSGKNRGLGIYFIRTLMDNADYTYKDSFNILTLRKQVKTTN